MNAPFKPNLKAYRTAFFDCDGVILDSNRLKSEAFARALEGEDPRLIRDFIAYHQTHGGISRYVKFTHFFKEMKKNPDFKLKAATCLEKYASICFKELLDCPEIPGIRKTLEALNASQTDCYVISGGDQTEITEVFRQKRLDKFFKKILGSPTTKLQHLSQLKPDFKNPCVYFGDSKSDWEAANAFGMDFIFVAGQSEWKDAPDWLKGVPTIQDFSWIVS